MNFRNRALAYAGAGAAGLFAAGAFAAPAFAAGPDIAVEVTGTTIAADAEGKFAGLDLKNVGDAKPAGLLVIFDVSKLDTTKVVFTEEACGAPVAGKITCEVYEEYIPAPGTGLDISLYLERKAGATGDAGELTVTVDAEGDTNAANDSATVKVGVGANGVDLGVVAEDINWSYNDSGELVEELVLPGGETLFFGYVTNQGDAVAKGLKVSVTLPEGATFSEVESGCTYSSDNRTVTCDYTDYSLIPADKDTGGEGEEEVTSGAGFIFPVKIAEGVTSPSTLADGSFSVTALGSEPYKPGDEPEAEAASNLPKVEAKTAEEIEEATDVDPTDNIDGYAILVGGSGGSGGGGGDLPVTGVQAGLIGGVGLAVLAGGGMLLLMARRRRVVLVAPDDEIPTA